MCKVAGVNKVTDQNRDNVWLFMMILGELMTPGNDDGLGYAAFDKNGKIFGEQWLHNNHAFLDLSTIMPGLSPERMANIYSNFGHKVVRDDAQSIILHTRAATCDISIKNVHPFVNDIDNPEIAIIHNGMIYNHNEYEKKYSTCDSEVIAHLYDKYSVSKTLANIDDVTGRLFGWYTVLTLAKDSSGKMVMDIFTDNGRLSSFFIPELNTRVYSSSAQDIQRAAHAFGFTLKDGKTMKANTSQRIDILTGEVLDRRKCKELKYDMHKVDGSPQVVWADGNFDDEDFVKAWFSRQGK